MNKNLLFSICLLVGAFSMKGQYKQAVGFNFTEPGLSLDYERFFYSNNNHHLSLRGGLGYSIAIGDLIFGTDFIYGFGKHHRFEVSYYLGFVPNNIIHGFDDSYTPPSWLTTGVRLNYAYHAKNNPMIYRIGVMPGAVFGFSKQSGNSSFLINGLNLLNFGVGYRF